MPTFTKFTNNSQVMFVQSLTPSLRHGFIAVTTVVSVHLILVTVITVTFLMHSNF